MFVKYPGPILNEMIRFLFLCRTCVCVHVTDDGQEHDYGMGGDAITSSSSLLRENGLSNFGVCVCAYIHVRNMIHLYRKREYDI